MIFGTASTKLITSLQVNQTELLVKNAWKFGSQELTI